MSTYIYMNVELSFYLVYKKRNKQVKLQINLFNCLKNWSLKKKFFLAKNVAADVADKLCESVSIKLEGKILGTFTGITSTVKTTLVDALVQLLAPKRRIDILRDVMEAQKTPRPYNIVFCGVNGVGKSTNLAKVMVFQVF